MASFSFDFLPKEKEEKLETSVLSATYQATPLSPVGQRKRPPFVWLPELLGKHLEERCRKEIVYSEIPIAVDDEATNNETQNMGTSQQNADPSMSPICYVDLESSSFSATPAGNEAVVQHQEQPTWKQTDMQPSVYEGGMKVWECSLDLVRYLAEEKYPSVLFHDDGRPQVAISVLELGCGHALPSCFLLREALRNSLQEPFVSFVLSDYNDFVVQDATLSNLVLNTAQVTAPEDRARMIRRHVRVGYGDWMDMSRQLRQQQRANNGHDGYFDLILAAETIYSDQTAQETAQLLAQHLRPHTGVALVATKRYYFGVGGGSDALRRHIIQQQQQQHHADHHFEIETVREYDNGSGNIRELLRVTHCGGKR